MWKCTAEIYMKYYLFNYSTTALILSCNVFPPICGSGSMVVFFCVLYCEASSQLQLWACMWGAFKSSFTNLQAMQGLPNASPKYWGPVKSNTVCVLCVCVCVRVWDNVCMKSNPDDWEYGLFRNLTHTFIMAFSHFTGVFWGKGGGGVQMWIGLTEQCLLRINKLRS